MSSAVPRPLPAPSPSAAPALTWKQAADDVFVATIGDEFAGYIAVSDSGHALFGALAQPFGTYPTRGDAQDALRRHAAPSRPRSRPRRGTPRRSRA